DRKLRQAGKRSWNKLRVYDESIDPKQKVEKKKPFQKSIKKSLSPHGRRENPFQERQSLMENVRKSLQQRIFSHNRRLSFCSCANGVWSIVLRGTIDIQFLHQKRFARFS
ncbi:hypothetical protein, partial [Oribacterium sp. oral taxon 078]|uniref:hypothetical protein n=1 Tax=Oribacterium sp. oral taxon 078 TaxID=652706 RepID=UPI001A99C1A3